MTASVVSSLMRQKLSTLVDVPSLVQRVTSASRVLPPAVEPASVVSVISMTPCTLPVLISPNCTPCEPASMITSAEPAAAYNLPPPVLAIRPVT